MVFSRLILHLTELTLGALDQLLDLGSEAGESSQLSHLELARGMAMELQDADTPRDLSASETINTGTVQSYRISAKTRRLGIDLDLP